MTDGVASLSISTLSAGTHQITAVYQGHGEFAGSTSPALTQLVEGRFTTEVFITSDVNPSLLGQTVVFTATVISNGGGTPTGSITVSEGEKIYGSSPLADGVGQVSVASLGSGLHLIRATYGGDATHKASTSPSLEQLVNAAAR